MGRQGSRGIRCEVVAVVAAAARARTLTMRTSRRHPILAIAAGVVVVLAVAIGAALAAFDWNWIKSPVTRYLSAKIGRPVDIHGRVEGKLGLAPLLTISDVSIGNAQ